MVRCFLYVGSLTSPSSFFTEANFTTLIAIYALSVHYTVNSFQTTVQETDTIKYTSGYATWFTAGGAIRIAHYDVIDDVITRKL